MLDDESSNREKIGQVTVCQVTSLASTSVTTQEKAKHFLEATSLDTQQLLIRPAPEHVSLQTINEFFKKYLPHKSPVNSKSLALSEYSDSEIVNVAIKNKYNDL